MAERRPLQERRTYIELDKELLEGLTVQKNVSQEAILITADKAKLCLIDYKNILESQRDWIAPAGILVTLVTSLFATDFKNFLGFQAEFWKALYALLSMATLVWLLIALFHAYKNRGKGEVDELINMLKKSP